MVVPRNTQDMENIYTFGSVNTFLYENWKGEISMRRVIPLALRFGRSDHYKEDQWLLETFDCDKNAYRTFALANILPR